MRSAVHIILAIAMFIMVKTVVSYVALSSFSIMYIEAEFDHDDIVNVYFGPSEHTAFRENFKKSSEVFSANVKSVNRVILNNHVIRKLRIDTGSKSGTVKLYGIEMISHFGPGAVFDHRALYENFLPNNAISVFRLEKDHVLLESNGTDPFLIFSGELVQKNLILENLLPLIVGVLTLLACRRFSSKSVPAFNDIEAKRSSSGINIGSLDGVRGLAALLVLGQHTGLTKTGGIFGVWLFFCLSGFLLAGPFVRQPALAMSGSFMTSYLFRRIKRIVPMYYVMITITILFAGKIDLALRHYLFLQADGHYWSISQEMCFYLILPLIMAANYLICRNVRLLQVIFIVLCAWAAYHYLTRDLLTLYGNSVSMKVMAGIFLTGVAAAFFYQFLQERFSFSTQGRKVSTLCSIAGLLILAICLYMSNNTISGFRHVNPQNHPALFGPAAALYILATLLSSHSYLDKIMNFLPFRAVGIVGYSFYLLHPKIIDIIRSAVDYFGDYYPAGISLFILAGAATYLISLFTYSYIERPFIKK